MGGQNFGSVRFFYVFTEYEKSHHSHGGFSCIESKAIERLEFE